MSFRRKSEAQRAWQVWVDQHRATLLKCSLPEFVFSDEPRWFRFVEHDGWDQESCWSITMLSPDQASALHDLLANEYRSVEYRRLLRALHEARRKSRRVDDSDHDEPQRPRSAALAGVPGSTTPTRGEKPWLGPPRSSRPPGHPTGAVKAISTSIDPLIIQSPY